MITAKSDNPEGTRKIAGSAATSGVAQFRIPARKCRMRRRAYVTVGEREVRSTNLPGLRGQVDGGISRW